MEMFERERERETESTIVVELIWCLYKSFVLWMQFEMIGYVFLNFIILSSSELKSQFSFFNCLLSDCLSICLSVHSSLCSSVHLFVSFFHFHILLQNHLASFNQTWHNLPWVKGIQVRSNEGPSPFQMWDLKKAKICW